MNDPYLELGASLYVPAVRPDLLDIANGHKHAHLRSVIFCTEDAIRTDQVDGALDRLAQALPAFERRPTQRFVRARNPTVLQRLLQLPGIGHVDGFVLPKVTRRSLGAWFELLGDRPEFKLMPTLETAEVFDPVEMRELRLVLCEEPWRSRILALRVGGNDLLRVLGVRRSCERTLYQTALGPTLAALAGCFKPYGLNLTAPVFEGLDHPDVLRTEVQTDLDHGLFGKTAIHPDQVPIIEAMYAVTTAELEMAEALLHDEAPAVFRMHHTMCEEATHGGWARSIRARARIYGVSGVGAARGVA